MLSGDQLYQMDFVKCSSIISTAGADLSIATIPVVAKEATEFGIMKTDEQNHITSFIEKPKAEILNEWVSDTGASMQQQGARVSRINGYLHF